MSEATGRQVVMMLDEEEKFKGEHLLSDYDFPKDYVNMAHPQDYKIVKTAITRELFYNMEDYVTSIRV
jgi:hypothetical protein